MFRLRAELLDRLKILAARDNRSLNNYVETILMDVAFNTPKRCHDRGVEEAKDDANLTPVDMSNYETFLKSLGV